MIKKITLGILAVIGALSIVFVSYSFFNQKREEGTKDNQLTETERLKIWEKDGSRYAAEYSQRLVEKEIGNGNFTASTMIPIHKKGGEHFVIDGVLQTHDGTARCLNYSCIVACSLLSDPRVECNWNCYNLYINGKSIMTDWERLPLKHAVEKYVHFVADRAGIDSKAVNLTRNGHSLYYLISVTQNVYDEYHCINMFNKDSVYIFNKIDSAMLADANMRKDIEQNAKRLKLKFAKEHSKIKQF